MLDRNLYDRLIEALLAAYPTHFAWERLTDTGLGVPLSRLLNPSVGLEELAFRVVQLALERRQLYEFLTVARDERGEDLELHRLVDEALGQLEITFSRMSDPFEALLVGRRQPFIDREKLRRFVRELAARDSSRVLEVGREADSGKSYSWQFIRFISNEVMPPKLPVLINVQPDHTPTGLLKEILIRVSSADAAGTIPTRGGESIGTWIRTVCGYTVGEIRKALWQPWNNRYDQLWLVLDFPRAGIDQDVRDLVYLLAEEINQCLDEVRLILLGFPEPLRHLEPAPLREQISPLDRSQLSAFFRDLCSQNGKSSDPEAIDLLLEGLLPYANGSVTGYTRKLNNAVATAVEFLLEAKQ